MFRRAGLGNEQKITSHGEGGISGEIAQLAGRQTLVEGRAGPEGCEAISFDAAHLRGLIIGSADSEILMRAFRRSSRSGACVVLSGRNPRSGFRRYACVPSLI